MQKSNNQNLGFTKKRKLTPEQIKLFKEKLAKRKKDFLFLLDFYNLPVETLLYSNVHLGEPVKRWNPHLKRFLFGSRYNIHLINLKFVLFWLREFLTLMGFIAKYHGRLLVVSESPAMDILIRSAVNSRFLFIGEKYLPGLITNFRQTTRLLKKVMLQRIAMDRKLIKFSKKVSGMINSRESFHIPSFIFSFSNNGNLSNESIGTKIPSVSLADTNCYSYFFDSLIPANNKGMPSLFLFLQMIKEVALEQSFAEKYFYKDMLLSRRFSKKGIVKF